MIRIFLPVCLTLSVAMAGSPLERPAELRAQVAAMEKAQESNRAKSDALKHERNDAWSALLKGPFKQAGGDKDAAALKFEAEAKRLDAEGRAKSAAMKAETNEDEIAALKIETAQLRRGKEDAARAHQSRILELARSVAGGAELAAKVEKLDAEIDRLQNEWGDRRRQIGEIERESKPISPEPKKPELISLELPPPADAAARMKTFATRNSPAEIEKLARDFFRIIDPKAKGVAPAVALFEAGKFPEALDAYRDYFFEKVTQPEKFGITADAFTDDSRQFMSVRHPPESWIADAMRGVANTTSHDLGDSFVMHVNVGAPGAVNWAYVAEQPVRGKNSVWLEFQRRFCRALGNDGGYEGLRDALLDGYILTGDAKLLTRWSDYMDDWYLNASRAMDESPQNIRYADAIIPRLVCGFVSRLRLTAQCRPEVAKQMPAATLARILIRIQEEYMSPNILVARTTRQNWNMMGVGFNVRNALLLPEFKTAQWAGREAKRCIDNAYLFSILPDGGVIEYGDEGHQGVWRERIGGVLQLLEEQQPDWATPEWRGELLDTYNQNVRFWIRHLKPDGYQHRDGLRSAREVYVGGVQSVYGPQSLNSQAPWVCAEPEAKRMLEKVFGPAGVPASAGIGPETIPPKGGTPTHLSDVSPFIGEVIMRGAWESNAPFFYMHAGRMPNSGGLDDATAFRVHDFGLNLLIGSPLSVDGRVQNAHYGMVDNVGSKTEYLSYNDGKLSLGRWHSSSNFDFAEGFYSGAYENKTGRQYRTTFQPGGNALRLKNAGEPAITNVSVARQVFFVRDPACWIVVDRIHSPAKHSYRQSYDLFTPVSKLDWYRRAKSPIPNAANRVVFDETKHTIRTDNPGFPNVTLHHFSSSPLRYEFDKDWHDLDHKSKNEISIAEDEWSKNRPELQNAMAFSRRVNVTLDAEGEATLVTLITSMEPGLSAPAEKETAKSRLSMLSSADANFEATFVDGTKLVFQNGSLSVQRGAQLSKFDVKSIAPLIQPVTFGPEINAFTDFVDVSIRCETAGVEIRYTLDGSDPTTRSAKYDGPVRLTKSARVKAVAMRPGLKEIPWQPEPGLVTIPTWAVFTKSRLTAGLQRSEAKPGLAWDYFEGNQFALAASSEWMPAKKSGTTTNLFDVSMRETGGAFGVRYSGLINVPADGVYTFHAPREFVMPDIEAGYDLRAFVDGREWEPAMRWHAFGSWSVALAKGAHEFKVIFVDTRSKPVKYDTWRDWPNPAVLWNGVAPALELSGPAFPRQPIQAAWLSH